MIWRLLRRQPLVGGYEFDLLILGVAVALLTIGGGAFALDKLSFFGLLY